MKIEQKTPKKMGVWNSMCYTVRTIWRADKGCILLSFYKNCTEEVYMSFFFILMLQMIYSYVEYGKSCIGLLRFVTLFCMGHSCIQLVSAWHAYYIRKKTPKVYAYIFNRVIDQAVRIELTKYEQPDFYDKFARALDECLTKAMDGLFSLTWATGCALDPLAEYKLNTNMMKNAGDATVIFISHRLSTTRDADRIYMFENGQIIVEVTHQEVMELGGKYEAMFVKQAYYYQDEVDKEAV